MKILFLDHQGVMYLGPFFKPTDILPDFNLESINVLNSIIKEVNCKIVISSDWKVWTPFDKMKDFYRRQGIISEPIGYTPKYEDYIYEKLPEQRSSEINGWLESNIIDKWVAIDDINMTPYLKNFIHINPINGLNLNIKDEIINYLIC